MLQNTFSDAGVCQEQYPPPPSASMELQLYDHILSIILEPLGKLELLVPDFPKPRSFWELEPELKVKSGGWALNLDQDILQELTMAFQKHSTTLKVKIPHHHLRCRRICTQHCSSIPKWKRRWSSRSEISSP